LHNESPLCYLVAVYGRYQRAPKVRSSKGFHGMNPMSYSGKAIVVPEVLFSRKSLHRKEIARDLVRLGEAV
jgi:hypothetical protein